MIIQLLTTCVRSDYDINAAKNSQTFTEFHIVNTGGSPRQWKILAFGCWYPSQILLKPNTERNRTLKSEGYKYFNHKTQKHKTQNFFVQLGIKGFSTHICFSIYNAFILVLTRKPKKCV